MATTVYDEKVFKLQDDKEVVLRPLPIGRLRRFMRAWGKFADIKDNANDDGYDIFLNCAGIALEHNFKGDFDSLRAPAGGEEEGNFLSDEYKEYLEGVLDVPTIHKIIDVCGGINLDDPKLVEQAMEMVRQDQDGMN